MNEHIKDKNIRYNEINYKEITDVLHRIGDIKYAIVKGEPLSYLCYSKFGARRSGDIDILVSRKNILKIEKILESCGYVSINNEVSRKHRIMCLSHSHQLPPYIKQTQSGIVEIDLNFDIFWGEYLGERFDIDDFLSDTINIDIYGITVRTLPALKAMIQLILHHYKEMNSLYHLTSHNCINYNMFKDIYYLVKNNKDEISINNLYHIGKFYNIIPYIFYVLCLTNQVFEDDTLKEYVEVFRTSEGEQLLDYYGLSENEKRKWKVDFRTRLNSKNLFDLIKNDLTGDDFKKLMRNRMLFG